MGKNISWHVTSLLICPFEHLSINTRFVVVNTTGALQLSNLKKWHLANKTWALTNSCHSLKPILMGLWSFISSKKWEDIYWRGGVYCKKYSRCHLIAFLMLRLLLSDQVDLVFYQYSFYYVLCCLDYPESCKCTVLHQKWVSFSNPKCPFRDTRKLIVLINKINKYIVRKIL